MYEVSKYPSHKQIFISRVREKKLFKSYQSDKP